MYSPYTGQFKLQKRKREECFEIIELANYPEILKEVAKGNIYQKTTKFSQGEKNVLK